MTSNESLKYFAPESFTDLEQLYANVLMGLHAASQPLTVLRSVLWPESVRGLTASELRELAETSSAAVERTCVLFNLTRELLHAESIRIIRNQFDAAATLREIEARFKTEFERAGIAFEVSLGCGLSAAVGDAELATQALATTLEIARSVSAPGSRVFLSAFEADSDTHIVVHTANGILPSAEAESVLSLALVGSLLRKQNGAFTYALNPFQARMRFKRTQHAGRSATA